MPHYSGRHNHLLTAVQGPAPTPEEIADYKAKVAALKEQHLSAIAAILPNPIRQSIGRMHSVRAENLHGCNLSAFIDQTGTSMRLEIFSLTPDQAQAITRFIANDLQS